MYFNIEIEDNELKYSIKKATEQIFKENLKQNIKNVTSLMLSDKDLMWEIFVKSCKELTREEIKNIMKQNNQTILQIMREEISKICKDSLEEMRLLKKISGED